VEAAGTGDLLSLLERGNAGDDITSLTDTDVGASDFERYVQKTHKECEDAVAECKQVRRALCEKDTQGV
jgi:hypothetical protein